MGIGEGGGGTHTRPLELVRSRGALSSGDAVLCALEVVRLGGGRGGAALLAERWIVVKDDGIKQGGALTHV